MKITPDQITNKKLILIKQMYRRAIILSSREHSMVDRIMALIAFDLTIETVLKTVIVSLDASKTPSDSFPGIISQTNDLLTSKNMIAIPDQRHIQHVHSLRNDAQHKARYPNKTDLDDCRIYVRDALKIFIDNVYGIDFEAITQTELINNEEMRQHLVDAEEYFQNGDFQKSSEWANVGLQKAIYHAGKPYVGSSMQYIFDQIAVTNHLGKTKGDRDTTTAFTRIQNTVRHLALGLDYSDQVRFNKIAGTVEFTLEDSHIMDNMKENISEDEAEFVLSFSIDAIVQIESRVGDVEKPFGQEHWW